MQQYPPDVIIRPNLPDGINVLTGYKRISDLVVAGERAAEGAVEEIQNLLNANK